MKKQRPERPKGPPITDRLEEVLAFLRERRWEGLDPDKLDRITSPYSKLITEARKATKGPRVKPDDLVVRQLAEIDSMLDDDPFVVVAGSIRKTWGYPYSVGRDAHIKRT